MPGKLCLRCGSEFPRFLVVDGTRKNLQNRKYCLVCSPLGEHNTRPLHAAGTKVTCDWHGCQTEVVRGRFCSAKCKNKFSVDQRRKKLKAMAVDYKGGACLLCGYKRCVDALTFHHMDPSAKDFGVSTEGYTRSWAKVKLELDKCVLLCNRCHSEVHAGLVSVP